MKVLLVVPTRPPGLQSWVLPPLSLGYLAAALAADHEVELLDCVREGMDAGAFARWIRKNRYDAIGLTSYSQDLIAVRRMLEAIKRSSPETITLVGGPHPAGDPIGIMEYLEHADYGFSGEGEVGVPRLLDRISGSRGAGPDIPNLIYRQDGVIRCARRAVVRDLDRHGIPAWDLLLSRPYPSTPPTIVYKDRRFAPLIATRGCPWACRFCMAGTLHGKRVRARSVESLVEEVDLLGRRYGVREFHFMDDNFTSRRDLMIEFCEAMIERNDPVHFASPNGVRLDELDEELLHTMKRAGWYLLCAGIESGSDRILKAMRKGLTVEAIRSRCKMVRRSGIDLHGFFIMGYPTETVRDVRRTIALSLDLDLVGATFTNFHPYPGTPIFSELKTHGRISSDEPEKWLAMRGKVIYAPEAIGPRRLKALQREGIIRFYSRPAVWLRIARRFRSPGHWIELGRRLRHYFF